MKSICKVASAITSVVRAFGGISLSAARTPRTKQTTSRNHRWRSIGAVALLACAFLLPTFAAQAAAVGTQTTVQSQTPNPSNSGQTVTFVVNVTAASGTTAPTGSVQLTNITNLNSLGSGTLSPTSTPGVSSVSIPVMIFPTGPQMVSVAYFSDNAAAFTNSSTTVTQTVNSPTTTTTTLTTPSTTVQVNTPVTFTATVTNANGTPTGAVNFFDGTTQINTTAVMLSGGAASFTFTFTTTGGHNITAQYVSNNTGSFANSNSNTVNLIVNSNTTTTTTLTTPSTTVQVNTPVTFTATVTNASGTPTGAVNFFDGTTQINTTAVPLSGSQASFTFTFTTTGPHNIVAAYTSNNTGSFANSNSNTINLTVQSNTTTTTTLTTPSTTVQVKTPVTFTATIALTSGSGTPTGSVNFFDGTTQLNTTPVTVSGGQAVFTFIFTTTGNHPILAAYTSDNTGSFANSNSNTINLSVNAGTTGTTTTLASSSNPSSPGQNVTFTATVTPATPGKVTPTGIVTFNDGSTTLGTGTLSTTGGVTTASFTTTTPLTTGSHNITAVYNGDTNFAGSTSTILVQNVNSASSSDSVKLHQMQISTTPAIAAAWGATTASAMDDAVSAGFGGNPSSLSPAGTGFTYYFNDDAPAQRSTDADADSLRRHRRTDPPHLAEFRRRRLRRL